METLLIVLFVIHLVGISVFKKFAAETAWWRMVLKWLVVGGIMYMLFTLYGIVTAIIFISSISVVGLVLHFVWCARHAIHPIKATPRKRYYELRGWTWTE
jgi:hypothetical protein